MKKNTLFFNLAAALCFFVGCSKPKGDLFNNKSYSFDPTFIGGSAGVSPPDKAPEISSFVLTPQLARPEEIGVDSNDASAKAFYSGVRLRWVIPKTYVSAYLNVGFKVFKKRPSLTVDGVGFSDLRGEALAKASFWDFNDTSRVEEAFEVATIKAADICLKDGTCSLFSEEQGPSYVSYAIFSVLNVDDGYASPRSAHREGLILAPFYRPPSPLTGETFLGPPSYLGQPYAPGLEAELGLSRYRLEGLRPNIYDLPPTLDLALGREVLEGSSRERSLLTKVSLWAGVDEKKGGLLLLPDEGHHRLVKLTRGDESLCLGYSEAYRELCEDSVSRVQFFPTEAIGQKTPSAKLDRSEKRAKAFGESRLFEGRAASIGYGQSGARYYFVADKARILVRKEDLFSCSFDMGEFSALPNETKGRCGFEASIGTFSPLQSCPFKATGQEARDRYACTEADLSYSLSDERPPTRATLKFPGAPVLEGDTLYIADRGGGRIVVIHDFERRIETCGRLPKTPWNEALIPWQEGSSESWTIKNQSCTFDDMIGAPPELDGLAGGPTDARFNGRFCLRGGERDGVGVPFKNVDGTIGRGLACLNDFMLTPSAAPLSQLEWRRAKMAYDHGDEGASDISPTTGLLSQRTRRMFRYPEALAFDHRGRLYVFDAGETLAEKPASAQAASIHSRVMIWQNNPFLYREANGQRRPCAGDECLSSAVFGQKSLSFGFRHSPAMRLGEARPPGFIPLSAMAVGRSEETKGLWLVTGQDARIIRVRVPDELSMGSASGESEGEGLSYEIFNEFQGPYSPDGVINFDTYHKEGVFSGISIDPIASEIIFWDTKRSIGVSWRNLGDGLWP